MADLLERLHAALAPRYRVLRELGEGGMAVVFLAEDLKHRRQVALKVLRPELAAEIGPGRFLREIELAAGLNHPHILPLHDSGEAGGFLYYVMPYVEQESLRGRLTREKQLPLDDALQIAREVADALNYAHSQGVIHRDIKPENILLHSGHAVMADFGIARAVAAAGGDSRTATMTVAGTALGTPAYMSPEQVAGSRDLDGRSDLYSLGCVLYEMLAGEPPFTAPTPQAQAHQHLAAEPPAVTGARPSVPESVARAVHRALAKNPADRFGSAARFSEALTSRESDTAAATAAPVTAARVRRFPALALGAAILLVAAGTLLILRPWRRAPMTGTTQSPARSAIAVLPFQNLNGEGPHAYFAGGLHEELMTQLAKVGALKVISRTSVMGYQGTSKPLKTIASELRVGSIVEGSVQVEGERLRVNVQLIDAATDEHLWAERYDRTLADAFAIQSEIAQQIVAAVGAALTDPERAGLRRSTTNNAEAYRLYLQGRDYERRPALSPEWKKNRETAQQLYEAALRLDPNFALAHSALSGIHGQMYWFRADPSNLRIVRAREEAQIALALAPDLPEAHSAMGAAHYHGRRDFRSALAEFTIALRGAPNDAERWKWMAWVYRRLGRWTDAVAAFERAGQLDPRDPNLFDDLGQTYFILRHYADAVRACDRALSLAPDMQRAALRRGWVYFEWQGQLDTLRATLTRIPDGTWKARARIGLLMLERNTDSLLQAVRTSEDEIFAGQLEFTPKAWYAGLAHKLRGDHESARTAFVAALLPVDSALKVQPDWWPLHASRGLILAGLGRRDEALREARWLQRSPIYRDDAMDGGQMLWGRVAILAQAGEADAAVGEIDRGMRGAYSLGVHSLRFSPILDPIRHDARFRALLAKYGGQTKAS